MGRLRLAITVLAVISIFIAVARWSPELTTVMSTPPVSDIYSRAADDLLVIPRATSTFAITRQMSQCDDWMTWTLAGFSTEQTRQNIATACETRADDILASSPTFSLAHLVKAGAARNRSETGAVVQALSLAQMTAPFEGQLATRRLRMLFFSGPDAIAPSLESDVKVVAQSQDFVGFLARFYWRYPERRPWLTEVFETLEPEAARRVFRSIRRAAPGSVE